ncbi:alkaline phosphatase PafA [Maribacter sp. HTCC2170]|uniref:alkaline phosphatase PafA n=1 Tax=Maribacter sp. (strain HTCC2170 / KCCM 42371) TaxID=313603 RepID=UPI00006B1AA6|nr:alkaline phosphatase PafA [Maribacter sp. HTCC2170]EAR00863.1 putative alkaline phosphatase [Maribacter sp. HTCC2170]
MHKNYLPLLFVAFLLVFGNFEAVAQKKSKKDKSIENIDHLRTAPKLVVGIVVDQMRYDYLTLFWNHYGDDGFKRLVNKGFNCKNNHFNYAPTSTGPGHTSVYTGTTPSSHGIIGNNWYDKEMNAEVYCASDDDYKSIGTTSDAGKMSPHRMTVTTVTDQLKLHYQMRSKTIAIALKDRGAVLPGGHTANAAYWFHGANEGNWITSSFYMNELPKWVNDFNSSNAAEQYKKPWTTIGDINTYLESGLDNNKYEGLFDGQTAPTFPHDLPSLWNTNGKYDIIKATPYGNSITADFAIAAIDGENLGSDLIPDFLAVSFSSTDYVGHKYGVNSKEIQDTYIRLDRDLTRLFKALDKKVGENEYTVFLTADHAAIHVPAYLKDQRIPAGYHDWDALRAGLDEFLKYKYGTVDLIKNVSNYQVFLDHDVIDNLDMQIAEVQNEIASELIKNKDMDRVYTGQQMWQNEYTQGIPYILQNGYNQKRSGDVLMVLKPGVISYSITGSTHGSPQIYDTHSPLIFYGKGIRRGSTVERTEIPDIAPTISSLLGIAFPSGSTGKPISKVIK